MSCEASPLASHSIGGDQVERIVFETRNGGCIYEELQDGRRFQWGQIVKWEPPHRVMFTWHPSRDPSTAQDVEIEFTAEGDGTRLDLTSSGWERWGRRARSARRGYDVGWGYLLNVWAGRRTFRMAVLDVITATLTQVMKLRGGREAEIARAGGQMPPAERLVRGG